MFFIRDCNDKIIGNPAGYRTMRGAQAQTTNPRAAVFKTIWAAVDARDDVYETTRTPLDSRARAVFSIRLNEAAQ